MEWLLSFSGSEKGWGFPGGSEVKNLPAVQDKQVSSLGQEDLEEGMEAHSTVLTWRIPRSESDTTEVIEHTVRNPS